MANLHSPGASGHARQPLIEGVANDALLLVLLCVSSVLLLVLFEYRRHTLSAPPPPPSDSEITILTRLNALWCYITGQPEAPIIQPGEGDARWSDAPTPTCPICIEEVVWAVETSCGHAFCGKCFCQMWQQVNQSRQKIQCPMDRRTVYGLFPSAVLRRRDPPTSALNEHERLDRQQVDGRIALYNEMFNANHLLDNLRWAGRLARQWDRIPLGLRTYVTALTALMPLYLLSPLDLVPEAVLGPAGLVDDVVVMLFLAFHLGGAFRAVVLMQG
eukprot:CAMPEP_0169457150 /NCGR_PEP_ID=MMETSP1042-20121227/16726_1 /TAXON_ID=464988 /ORGANISM="Hemiselmis andersenii, Strain CCMP1180" /LENGTH=272 /DNA_ID=CAMNT_0009569407 /DNA_START=136 /DNA_END=950 /DNA_ORIENTATION=+